MPSENMKDYNCEDGMFDYGTFDPFSWNEYYLDAMEKGTTQKGNTKYSLRFKTINADNVVFDNIILDDKGKMMFASQHNKILNALVQGKEKTIAEALRKAKGNNKITVFLKCEMDNGYMRIADVKQKMTEEDKMNAALAESKTAPKDDDDLPL